MSSSNLIRWSGLAALVGGVLLIVVDVAQFIVYGDEPDSVVALTNAWVILSIFALVASASQVAQSSLVISQRS